MLPHFESPFFNRTNGLIRLFPYRRSYPADRARVSCEESFFRILSQTAELQAGGSARYGSRRWNDLWLRQKQPRRGDRQLRDSPGDRWTQHAVRPFSVVDALRENSRERRRDFACNATHLLGYDNAQSAGGLAVAECRHAAGRVSTLWWEPSRAFEQGHDIPIVFRGGSGGLPDPGRGRDSLRRGAAESPGHRRDTGAAVLPPEDPAGSPALAPH